MLVCVCVCVCVCVGGWVGGLVGACVRVCVCIATQSKCTKRRGKSSAIKQLLETLFAALKVCTDFTTDDFTTDLI